MLEVSRRRGPMALIAVEHSPQGNVLVVATRGVVLPGSLQT